MGNLLSKDVISYVGDNEVLLFNRRIGEPLIIKASFFSMLDNMNVDILEKCDIPKKVIEKLRNISIIADNTENMLQNAEDKPNNDLEYIQKNKRLRGFVLFTTDICNLGCPHCILACSWAHIGRCPMGPMSLETAVLAIEKYIALKERIEEPIQISFSGAEPLNNWKLISKFLAYCEDRYADKYRFVYSMNTNLQLLDEKKAAFLDRYHVKLGCGIDGIGDINDMNRPLQTGDGSFSRFFSNVMLLRKYANVRIEQLTIVLTNANFLYVDESLIDFIAREIGPKGIDINTDLLEMINQPISDIIRKIASLYDRCRQYGIDVRAEPFNAFLGLMYEKKECFCGSFNGTSFTVLPNSDIITCNYSRQTFGKLDQLDTILGSPEYRDFIKSQQKNNIPFCFGCELETVCLGGCMISRERSEESSSMRAYRCALYKEGTRYMINRLLRKATSKQEKNIYDRLKT